jgi:hypothetical protein
MGTETNQTQAYQSNNVDYTTPSIVAIRLNNDPFLHEFYKFISGKMLVRDIDTQGNIVEKTKIIGTPRANDPGVQEIMSQVISIINVAGVQGNFDRGQYDQYVYDAHVKMAIRLVINRETWGIHITDVPSILDMFVQTIRTYMTRPIDNKERESYTKSLQSHETNTLAKQGALNILRGGV